jgi:hypothetical protein
MSRLLAIAALALFTQMSMAQSPLHKTEALSDADLDQVTAAGFQATVNTAGNTVNFSAAVPTPNGLVSAVGNASVLAQPLSGTNTGSINLSGNAQQGLNSIISINAVNSVVNVLLNLNVTLNSTVGSISQSNLGSLAGLNGLGGLINAAAPAGKH